jgi:plastocyanin
MQRPMRRLTAIALALMLSLAACGGDDDGGGEEPSGGSAGSCPSGAVVIDMVDIKFDPEEATAGVGQDICWVNQDEIDHNAVAESGADFKSELFGKGETFTATVDSPGTVEYVCTIHPGMEGTVTVER